MDEFKRVNDTHGHEEGDALLRQFGVRLLNGVRETDMAAPLAGGSVEVGANIGAALQLPHELQDPVRLQARADQAMYEAEHKGRGRVALAADALEREAS